MSSSRRRCAPNSNSSDENAFDRLMRREQCNTTQRVRQSKNLVGPNAFDLLMSGKKRPRPEKAESSSNNSPYSDTSSGRFVLCPMGCGAHISELVINTHIDRCTGKDNKIIKNEIDLKNVNICSQQMPPSKVDSPRAVAQQKCEPSPPKPNAFAHMMDQSERVFSAKPLRQRFHIGEDGTITWSNSLHPDTRYSVECSTPSVIPKQNEIIRWSASVTLKGTRMLNCGERNSIPPQDLKLTVSSAFPSAVDTMTTNRRLVRKHSRLSVPVLKSVLQKSIRRRRPLPSVRVAMELIDKSLGDFLRRMPIIILEDSTLHPDFPLLVWLMIADSKGFVMPPQLLTRVLQIVYEIASCPYADHADVQTVVSKDSKQTKTINENEDPLQDLSEHLCLSSPAARFEKEFACMPDICVMMIRTMLIRAQYGGMTGDIKMLHRYIDTWRKRFSLCNMPDGFAETIFPDGGEEGKLLKWWNVPERIHCSARKQSSRHIIKLDSIEKLVMKDLCVAGIDFHCSSVLDSIIGNPNLFAKCCECLAEIPDVVGPCPLGTNDRQSWILGILKTCMWEFSSGVNHRRPLVSSKQNTDDSSLTVKDAVLKKFWIDMVCESATKYMKAYLEERVVH